ncbi:UDP-3-O-(3-hydroxymyristoyl)glucosamine N-acyltransferase [Catenovulum sediminis]|uniref:UDP-3-O-acylglucosamine N-acyltransferase n=1 Tax=Catenovulum sediminis TaxID=1740262 RepID=A0ABV1RJ83_9ALTE|nr:UDP-3-O-(3-hydroxymyristoyl)glucosamine N-acyltransferase [Catenovulum sediminis]
MTAFTIAELAEQVSAELIGNKNEVISSTASIDDAQPNQVTFFNDKNYAAGLAKCQAGLVILKAEDQALFAGNKLISDNPYLTYAKVAQILDSTPAVASTTHPSAQIDASAVVSPDAYIGAHAVISANAVIEKGCQIGPGVFIGQNSVLGAGSKIYPNAVIYHNVKIGENCIIHANAVIGSDGFGFANDQGNWIKIPQVGGVTIGNHVEIGANTSIDRGALHDTIIHNGVKLDNQIHIAHNVEIGENSALAARTAIAGSTKIGKRCTFAGCVAVNGHIEIGDDVHFTGTSMVTQSFKDAGVYSSGMPAVNNKEWRKNTARLRKIESLYDKVKMLEGQLKSLK